MYRRTQPPPTAGAYAHVVCVCVCVGGPYPILSSSSKVATDSLSRGMSSSTCLETRIGHTIG